MIAGLETIQKLKQELACLGYHGSQIDRIIVDELGGMKVEHMSEPQAQQLVVILNGYLEFARKCHQCQ
ncbi:MAG: hypothetical protein P4L50_01910 [Anaerolineaceae bacterium]|nr:hypothetical protein [Anaerolineaceae bacterium]